jgi:ribosome-binding factor A
MARRARTTRMRRVDTALRQVLAEVIARELSDPRLGFVTITHVEATQDVREAKVFYTTLRTRERKGSQEALDSARGLLQAQDAVELTRLIDEVTRDSGTGT